MTNEQFELFRKIRRVLGEIHQQWVDNIKEGIDDGHCKSSEGMIEVHYPTWFDCDSLEEYCSAKADGIGIYSYVFGPSRMHDFTGENAFVDALAEVENWRDEYLLWTKQEIEETNNNC